MCYAFVYIRILMNNFCYFKVVTKQVISVLYIWWCWKFVNINVCQC